MWTGIDISNDSIKVMQITQTLNGRIKVIGAARLNYKNIKGVNGYDDETASAFRRVFQEGGILPKHCIIGIGGRELNLRSTLSMPLKNASALTKLIEYEISEIAGNNISELYYDFAQLNLSEKSYVEQPVLIGLAKKSWIDPQIKFFYNTGIPITDICPEPIALWFAYRSSLNLSMQQDAKEETVLLLDIGENNINAIIAENGKLIFARNIAGGGVRFVEDIKNDANTSVLSAMGQIHSIFEGSLAFCRTQLKREIDINRVLVSGNGASMRDLSNYLYSFIKRPVEFFNPFKTLDLSAINEEARGKLVEGTSDMVIALGLAQAGITKQDKISLLPTRIKQNRKFYHETIYIFGGLILMALLPLVLLISVMKERQGIVAELDKLTPQQEKIKTLTKEIDTVNKKTGRLESEYQSYFTEAETEIFFAKTLLAVSQFLSSQLRISEITLGRFYQPAGSYKTVYEPDKIIIKGYLADDTGLAQLEQFYSNIDNNVIYPLSVSMDQKKLSKIEGISPKGKWEFEVIVKKR